MLCEEDSATSYAGAQKGLVNSSSGFVSCGLEHAFKNSSYKGPNRRSNSCCDETCASAEEETLCSWVTGSKKDTWSCSSTTQKERVVTIKFTRMEVSWCSKAYGYLFSSGRSCSSTFRKDTWSCSSTTQKERVVTIKFTRMEVSWCSKAYGYLFSSGRSCSSTF
nr:hypothetical protein [Tanacetum cinerariifolium]